MLAEIEVATIVSALIGFIFLSLSEDKYKAFFLFCWSLTVTSFAFTGAAKYLAPPLLFSSLEGFESWLILIALVSLFFRRIPLIAGFAVGVGIAGANLRSQTLSLPIVLPITQVFSALSAACLSLLISGVTTLVKKRWAKEKVEINKSEPLKQEEIDFLFQNQSEVDEILASQSHRLGRTGNSSVVVDNFDYSVFSNRTENIKLEKQWLNSTLLWQILKFAFPLILLQMATAGFQFVDILFVSKIDAMNVAAMGLSLSVFSIALYFQMGCALGLEALLAQAFGARDTKRVSGLLSNGVLFTFIVGVVLCFALSFFEYVAPLLVDDQRIYDLSIIYIDTVRWSLLPLAVFLVCSKYLQIAGKAKLAIIFAIIGNLGNALLNYVLINGITGLIGGMGIKGAALATVASSSLMALSASLAVVKINAKNPAFSQGLKPQKSTLLALTKMGLPISIHLVFEFGSFTVFAILIAKMGEAYLAAHTLLQNYYTLFVYMFVGLSSAVTAVVGGSAGRKDINFVRKAAANSLFLTIALGVLAYGVLFIFRVPAFSWITSDQRVVEIALDVFLVTFLTFLFEILGIAIAAVLRGSLSITKATTVTYLSLIYFFGMPLSLAMHYFLDFKILSVWLGWFFTYFIICTVLGTIWFKNRNNINVVRH